MKKRLQNIYKIIKQQGEVKVNELANFYHVTEKTIRMDLQQLEDSGLIKRTHGGGKLADVSSPIYPSEAYNNSSTKEKEEIALKAIEMIKPYDTIIFDDGTTNYEIAKRLGDFPLVVITNDIRVASCLINKENISVYFVGGTLTKQFGTAHTFVDTDQELNLLKNLQADYFFVGTNSISENEGFMVFNNQVKNLKKTFMSISKQTICVATSNKFDKASFVRFANFKDISTVITDSSFNMYNLDRYSKHGLNIIVADRLEKQNDK